MDYLEIALEFVLMAGIVIGSLYLLYRSVWKKKGRCCGCDAGACSIKKKN